MHCGPIGSNTRWLERAVASGQTRGRSPNSRRYDAAPVNFDLSDEQGDIQRLVREFADGEVRPVAEELDREKRFPYEIVEKLGNLGLMGIPYPQEYGGGGSARSVSQSPRPAPTPATRRRARGSRTANG